MIVSAAAVLLGSGSVPTDTSGQILSGRSFALFAARTEQVCPARHLRQVTPGDLDGLQDRFRRHLPPIRQRRLDAADRARARCAGRNGLSCPVAEALDAMRRTGLLRPFATFACEHDAP